LAERHWAGWHPGPAAFAASLPGGDQHHRKPAPGLRIRTRCVTHWQNGRIVRRWMASAFLRTEKHFNKIAGHRDLWALESILNPSAVASQKTA